MSSTTAYTLLIVDDSIEDRQIIIDHLRRHSDHIDYTILEAGEVGEALALCAEVAIDCALVDYRLPDATGVDFLRALARDHSHEHIGVVLLTGMGNEDIAVAAMREGAVDYINKSTMRPEVLLRAMEHARSAVDNARALEHADKARILAQSEQMRSEGDLQRLMESIRDYAIITLDPHGRAVRWGAGARTLLGYHDQEALGLRFADMLQLDAGGDKDSERELKQARNGPVSCDGRWFVRRNGGVFWGTSVLSPIDDELGSLCGFALVIHNLGRGARRSESDGSDPVDDLAKILSPAVAQLEEGLQGLRERLEDSSDDRDAAVLALLDQVRELQEIIGDSVAPAEGSEETLHA